MRKSIVDADTNISFNKERWGSPDKWSSIDHFGYQWGNGVQQAFSGISRLADRFLRPYVYDRYDLKVLELSPGAGRFTAELIRYAQSIDLLDMNQACLDICRERFEYIPTRMRFYLNDGVSCNVIEDSDYDLIASFDSMVHVHPDILRGYVHQLAQRLNEGGILWIDHSGRGAREVGHRTDVTDASMAEFAKEVGLQVVAQAFRNDHDVISVMRC